MQIDPENKIVKLCGEGMMLEGEGKTEEAKACFERAWSRAGSDLERFISAHYLARHQDSVYEKLKWDETALGFALRISDQSAMGAYPSLYLNIGKCYEDLNDFENAERHYQLAFSFSHALITDGYGQMILRGIVNGLERVSPKLK